MIGVQECKFDREDTSELELDVMSQDDIVLHHG
jgi:hypothetical protein